MFISIYANAKMHHFEMFFQLYYSNHNPRPRKWQFFFFFFAPEQNAIWIFSLIKGHKEKAHMRERGQEREREIWSLCAMADCTDKHFAGSVHSLYACLCVQSSTWKNAQPGKRLFPSFKRSCMLYMPSQTHPHTNTPINGCSQTPFVPLEFLKKGCHLAQKLLLCHYCVCSIGNPPIPLSVSFCLFLSLITGLQKVPNTKDWLAKVITCRCTASGLTSLAVFLS